MIATGGNQYTEALLDLPEVLVKLPAEVCQVAGVVWFQYKFLLAGFVFAVQCVHLPRYGVLHKPKDNGESAAVNCRNCRSADKFSTQGVGQGFVNENIGEVTDHTVVAAAKVDHPVVLGSTL